MNRTATAFSIVALLAVPAAAQTKIVADRLVDYRWYAGQYLKSPLSVTILDGPKDIACEQNTVKFIFLHGQASGSAAPFFVDVPALWDKATGRCFAELRWRLSDAPGEQVVIARLNRIDPDKHPDDHESNSVKFRAIAHAPAALLVGLTWVGGVKAELRGTTVVDTTDRLRRQRPFQPVVGGVIPLQLAFLPASLQSSLLERVRIVAATTFNDAGSHNYVGVELASIAYGIRAAALPVQVAAGYRFGVRATNGYFLAVYANASSFLANAVTGFIPK